MRDRQTLVFVIARGISLAACNRTARIDGPMMGLALVFSTDPRFRIADIRIEAGYRSTFSRSLKIVGYSG